MADPVDRAALVEAVLQVRGVELTQAVWLRIGMQRGWISGWFCEVHDFPPLSATEQALVDAEGGDMDALCLPVVRLYEAP